MFCPEDGAKIEPDLITTSNVCYPACPMCNSIWTYHGEEGNYILAKINRGESK